MNLWLVPEIQLEELIPEVRFRLQQVTSQRL